MKNIENNDKYVIKEEFYDDFKCIAGACSFTCCSQWEISMDEPTKEQWQLLKPPPDMKPRCESLADYITVKDGLEVIQMTDDYVCPFLNEEKLCRLVIERGEHCLSKTCQTFPRQIHVYDDHIEYNLDPGCPEVLDRLYACKTVSWIREGNAEKNTGNLLMQIRDYMTKQVADSQMYHTQGMLINAYMILEMLEQKNNGLSRKLAYQQLQSQSELIRETILGVETFREDTLEECNELLQDLMENYLKKGLYADYLETLSMWAKAFEMPDDDTWTAFVSAMQPFKKFLRNYLCSAIHANMLAQGESPEDMMIQLEWISMTYAAIRHTLYLVWENTDDFIWNKVRDYIVVMTRIMGYAFDDIREYIQNSFESEIWDWGYFALILGSDSI